MFIGIVYITDNFLTMPGGKKDSLSSLSLVRF